MVLTIESSCPISKIKKGDSVAIDGGCLSVVRKDKNQLTFFISPETIDKTRVKIYKKGDWVNVEFSLKQHDFIGGHYVLGHVDTTSKIKSIEIKKEVWLIKIQLPKQFSQYVVYKGSIAVNGISLTVNKVTASYFEVCIIPITLEKTNLSFLQKGSIVNLEFDILAKYTEKILKK
jgi:riboflavin synthase